MSGHRLPVWLGAVIGTAAALGVAATGSAVASSRSVHRVGAPATVIASPGKRVHVHVTVRRLRSCTVAVGSRRKTVRLTGATRVAFTMRVDPRARPGIRKLKVRCRPAGRRIIRLRVRRGATNRHHATRRTVRGSIRATVRRPKHRAPVTPPPISPPSSPPVSTPTPVPVPPVPPTPAPAPMTDADALAFAQAKWDRYGADYLTAFRNGQCTDWAEQKRPDIVERGTVRAWASAILAGEPLPVVNWTGYMWDDNARAAGMEVGTTPRAGAIVVFEPGVYGAGASEGHVGYVESVAPDGTWTTSDENVGAPYQMGSRTLPASAPAAGGISFIH